MSICLCNALFYLLWLFCTRASASRTSTLHSVLLNWVSNWRRRKRRNEATAAQLLYLLNSKFADRQGSPVEYRYAECRFADYTCSNLSVSIQCTKQMIPCAFIFYIFYIPNYFCYLTYCVHSTELHCDSLLHNNNNQQPFNGFCSGTTWVGRYQKKHSAFCLSIGLCCVQAGFPYLLSAPPPPKSPQGFLQAGCPSCRPTNSVKALKAQVYCTVTV